MLHERLKLAPPELPTADPSFPTSHLPILKEGPTMDNSIRKAELMKQQSPTPKMWQL